MSDHSYNVEAYNFICSVLLTSLCVCGQKKMSHNMDFGAKDKKIVSTFMRDDNSQKGTLSEAAEDGV